MTMTYKRALEAIKTIVDEVFGDEPKTVEPTVVTLPPLALPAPVKVRFDDYRVTDMVTVPTIREDINALREKLSHGIGWAPNIYDFEKLVDIVDRLEKRQAWVNPPWTFIPPFPVIPASPIPNGTIPMPYQPAITPTPWPGPNQPFIGDPSFPGSSTICGQATMQVQNEAPCQDSCCVH